MDKKYKTLIKNIGYLTISNFASKILVFLLVPLYTSILTTAEYGRYDAIITTVQFLTPIVILNVSDGVMRYLLDKKYDRKEIYSIGYKYIVIGILLIGSLCILNSITGIINFLHGYELYCFLYSIFYILNNHYIQWAKGENKVSIMAFCGTIGTVAMLVSNILFLLVFNWGLDGFFIANILSQAIPVIIYSIKLKAFKGVTFRYNHIIEKEILIYSIPLIFNTIGWTINSSLDKYCIIYFLGIETSALVAVAYKIPTILSVIYAIFTQAWQISAINAYEQNDKVEFYSSTFLFVNAMGAALSGGLIIFNRLLSKILFANEFYVAWKFVPFLLLSAMFNQTAGFVGPLLSAKKDSAGMAKAAVWGSISNFILNIVFIILIGAQGAVVATAISSFIIYFVRWWYAKDLLDKKIYIYLYSSWIFLLISAVAEVVGINWYVQIICFLAICYINKKQVIKIFNFIKERVKK